MILVATIVFTNFFANGQTTENGKDKILEIQVQGNKKVEASTILAKIEKTISTYEKNTKLTQDKKDALLSQLGALKEIIQEKIDANSATVENINIDELLK
jgi:multidrug efflux pump subunit AcrA (membrane-fusion protein)